MDKELIQKLKGILEGEKERLTGELARFTTKNKHNPEDYDADFPELGDK
jgi:DnaK suppressor protein